jgi:hypothetical protein
MQPSGSPGRCGRRPPDRHRVVPCGLAPLLGNRDRVCQGLWPAAIGAGSYHVPRGREPQWLPPLAPPPAARGERNRSSEGVRRQGLEPRTR